jgi:hypothetical protein
MKFSLFIDTDSKVTDANQISEALKYIINSLKKIYSDSSGRIKDEDGCLIGNWKIEFDESSEDEEECV